MRFPNLHDICTRVAASDLRFKPSGRIVTNVLPCDDEHVFLEYTEGENTKHHKGDLTGAQFERVL